MAQEYRAKGAPTPPPEHERPGGPHKYRWVFHGPPVTAPGAHVPFQIPEEFADDLGRHLEALSFWTRDALLARADAEGRLDVSTLPAARIRQDPPEAGPRSWLNPGPWVPVSTPLPSTAVPAVDLTELSDEEAEAVRVETEAVQDGLRRRERWRKRLDEADPRMDDDKPGDGNVGGGTA